MTGNLLPPTSFEQRIVGNFIMAGRGKWMGTEEVLLIRHVTCGHKQQRRRAEIGHFPVSGLPLDDRCCASHPADITRRNPPSLSALHLAAARCQFRHCSLHQPHALCVTVFVSSAAGPVRCGVNLIAACRGLEQR